jgi:hypothetical protein
LDDSDEIGGVDFQNPVHALQRERNAAAHRHATADIAVAGTARRDGNPVFICEPQDFGNGFGGAGQGDGVGQMRCEPFVAGIFFKNVRCQNDFAGQDSFEVAERFGF